MFQQGLDEVPLTSLTRRVKGSVTILAEVWIGMLVQKHMDDVLQTIAASLSLYGCDGGRGRLRRSGRQCTIFVEREEERCQAD